MQLVPRWAVWTARATALCTIPSGLWRIAMGLQIPVGFTEQGLREFDIPGWGVPYVFGLSLVCEALALLTFGLVQPWGEVAPRWLPLIGGRRIPVLAAVIPAALGAIAVTVITTTAVTGWASAADTMAPGSMDPNPMYAVVMSLCYAPLLAWGPLLAAVTVHYYLRRTTNRPGHASSVTWGVSSPGDESSPAGSASVRPAWPPAPG